MSKPTLAELEAMAMVAKAGSFRAAARALALSPSALTHAIASLEAKLGVRVFRRSTRSVGLTDEGEGLLTRLQPALLAIQGAVAEVNERSGTPSGSLRLVAPRGPAQLAVLPAVLEMRRRHPAVLVELVTDGRLVDIVADGFDAGVRYAGTVPLDMVAVPCSADSRIAIVGAPSYFKRHPPPRRPQDLADHECVRYSKSGVPVRHWALRSGKRPLSVAVQGHLVVDDEAFLLDAALGGEGLAYLTQAAAAPHLASGKLVQVLERHSPRFEPVQLFYPSRRLLRAALRAFVDIVKERRR